MGNILVNYSLSNELTDEEIIFSHFTVDGYNEAKAFIRKVEKSIK